MKTEKRPSNSGGFVTVAGILASWFTPAPVYADDGDHMVCSIDTNYEHRRLNSKESENVCQTYKGQVILVVNTASRCAFTGQYEGLEKLYKKYRERGFVVLGFPSNDFGNQEPGTEESIKEFCRLTYGVRFPMYSKTVVTGEHADPLYKSLAMASGGEPKWNFHKYLIDREGRVVGSFSSFTSPTSNKLVDAIEKIL